MGAARTQMRPQRAAAKGPRHHAGPARAHSPGFGFDAGSRERGVTELQRTAGNGAVQRAVGGMLRVGSRGPQVKALQAALGIADDGIFGPATKAAVVAYQRANGLAPDGIAGPKTLGALGLPGGGAAGGKAAPQMPASLRLKLELVRQALRGRVTTTHSAAPEAATVSAADTVQRDDEEGGFFDDVVGAVSDTASDVADTVSDAAGSVADTVSDAAGAVADTVSDAAGAVADTVSGAVDSAIDTGAAIVTGAVDSASGIVDSAVEGVGEVADELGIPQAIDAGVAFVDSAVTAVGEAFAQVDAGVRELLGPVVDELEAAIKGMGRGLRADVDFAAVEAVVDKFLDGFDPAELANQAKGATGSTTFAPTNATTKHTGTFEQAANAVANLPEAGSVATGTSRSFVTFESADATTTTVVSAAVTINQTITLPTWTDRVDNEDAALDKKQKAEWARFEGAIGAHEAAHVDKDKAAFKNVHAGMVGKTVAEADKVLALAETDAKAKNAAFDASTSHGKTSTPTTALQTNFGQIIKVPPSKKP